MLFAAFSGGVSLQRSVNFEFHPAVLKIQFSPRRKHRPYCKCQQKLIVLKGNNR